MMLSSITVVHLLENCFQAGVDRQLISEDFTGILWSFLRYNGQIRIKLVPSNQPEYIKHWLFREKFSKSKSPRIVCQLFA